MMIYNIKNNTCQEEIFNVNITTRIKILFALKEVELCVYDICAALSLKQSTVSQQLR